MKNSIQNFEGREMQKFSKQIHRGTIRGWFIQSILAASTGNDAARFEEQCRFPRETQEAVLKRILRENETTAFGNQNRFPKIRSMVGYQNAVPSTNYEFLRPYIECSAEGKDRILTQESPVYFATTSGTTGAPKLIPTTPSSRKSKSNLMRRWLYYASKDHPEMLNGKILAMVSPEIDGSTKGGIPMGSESGHAYRHMPALMRSLYAIPYEVFEIEDYASKYYTILRIAIETDISAIGTCNPSTILLLAQKLQEHKEMLIKDVREGVINPRVAIPKELRENLEYNFSPNPMLSQRFEKLIENTGGLLPKDLWPNLALIGCWKGGSAGLYLNELRGYFSPITPCRDWGYLSSEARGSVPITDNGCGGILAIDTNFYEFVPEESRDSHRPTFLTADELEHGKRYYVYLTTESGLYRYDIDDLLEVMGFFHETPIVSFVQKGKGVSSMTGEKLYEAQVCEAVRSSGHLSGQPFEFICATPDWGHPPRYSFLVEEKKQSIPRESLLSWVDSVDKEIQRLNPEYKTKRASLRLESPIVKVLKKGESDAYRRSQVESGRADGQFKILKLNPDPKFQDHFQFERVIEPEQISTNNLKDRTDLVINAFDSRFRAIMTPTRETTEVGSGVVRSEHSRV